MRPLSIVAKNKTMSKDEQALYDYAISQGIVGQELASFMAQTAHESGNFKGKAETKYSFGNLKGFQAKADEEKAGTREGKTYRNWVKRLQNDGLLDSKGAPTDLAKNLNKDNKLGDGINNSIYGNRAELGNRDYASGDGSKFRGNGYIQLTGRANTEQIGKDIGADLVTDPSILNRDPELSRQAAVAYWKRYVRPAMSRKNKTYDDTKAVTQIINGGQTGIKDRKEKTGVYYRDMVDSNLNNPTEFDPRKTKFNSFGAEGVAPIPMGTKIRRVQQALTDLGYKPGVVDGLSGPATTNAIKAYQTDKGLPVTGVLNKELQASLLATPITVPPVAAPPQVDSASVLSAVEEANEVPAMSAQEPSNLGGSGGYGSVGGPNFSVPPTIGPFREGNATLYPVPAPEPITVKPIPNSSSSPERSNSPGFTQPPPQLQQPIIKEEPLMKMQYLADGTEEVIPPYILDSARPRVPSQVQMTPPVIQEFSAPTIVTEAPPPPVQTTPAEPMVRPSGGFGSNIEYDYAAYLRETGYNDVPAVRDMFRRYMNKMNARSFTYGANTNPKLFGDNGVGFSGSPDQLAVPSIDYGYPVLSEQPMATNRNAPYPIAPMSTGGGFNPQTRPSYDSARMMEINNPLGEGMNSEPTVPAVPAVQQQVTGPFSRVPRNYGNGLEAAQAQAIENGYVPEVINTPVADPRNLGGSEGYGPNVSSSNVLDYNPRNTGEAAFQLQTEQNLNDKLYTDRLKLQREIARLEGAAITPYDFERLQKMKDQLVTMGGSTIENPKTDQLLEAESNYNESIINDRNDATMSKVSRDRRIANDTVSELEKTLATADPAFKPLIETRLNEARAALENAENAFNFAQANLETVPLNTVTNVPPIDKKVVVNDPAMDNRENVIYDLELNNGSGLTAGKDANNNTVITNKQGTIITPPNKEEIDKISEGLGDDTDNLLGSLGPIFKSLFGLETQDMTRALGFYLMSRASGASHAGSMRWAGGTVLKQAEARDIRNDAKTDAAIKAFAGVKDTYTTAAASKINKLLSEGKLLEAQTVMSDPKSKTFRGRYGIDADDAGTPMMRPGSTIPVLIFTGTDGQVFKKTTVDGKEGFEKISTEEYTNLRERVVGDNRDSLRNDLESAMTKMNSTLFRQPGRDKETDEPYEGGMFGGQDQLGVIAAIMKKSDELCALVLDNIPTDILDRFVNIAELAESQGIKKINAVNLLDMIYVGGQGLVNTEKLTTDDGEGMLTSSQIGSFTDAFKEMFPGIKGQPNYSAIQSTFAAAEANADTGVFSTVKGVTEVAKASTEPKLTADQIKKISSMPNVYTASVLLEAFKLQSKK